MKILLTLIFNGDTRWVDSHWHIVSKQLPNRFRRVPKEWYMDEKRGYFAVDVVAGGPKHHRLMKVIEPYIKSGRLRLESKFKRVYSAKELIRNCTIISGNTRPEGPEIPLRFIPKIFRHDVVCPVCNAIEETQIGPIIFKTDKWAKDVYQLSGYTCMIVSRKFKLLLENLNVEGLEFRPVMLQSGETSERFFQMEVNHHIGPLVRPTGIDPLDVCKVCRRPEHFPLNGDEFETYEGIHIPPEDAEVPDELHFSRHRSKIHLLMVTSDRIGFNQPGSGFTQGRFRFLVIRNDLFSEIAAAKIKGMTFRPAHLVD